MFHSWVHRAVVPHYLDGAARPTQFGESHHSGTDFCGHFARSYWLLASSSCQSGCQVFVDVVGAFDAVIRRYISDDANDDERVIHVLQAMGMGPEVLHGWVDHIRTGGHTLIRRAGAGEHLRAIISEVHTTSWHTTQGL